MDFNKFNNILRRYQNGEANETETALVEAWYRSYQADEQELNVQEAELVRGHISGRVRPATAKRSVFRIYAYRIAAALAIFGTIGFFSLKSRKNPVNISESYITVTTGTNGLKQLTLPDGSSIWLNAASRLKVPQIFTGKTREVTLVDGEAFFDIKHDTQHPFIVHTKQVNVQVLGTSFNVRAYSMLPVVSVSVATGKVGVTGGAKTLGMLLPGQQLNYNTLNGEAKQATINPAKIQSWKEGSTYLDQATFKELAMVVKNIYGLTIKAGSKKISNYRFSLKLVHNLPKKQIIELISQLHHTQFRKEGNDIVLY